MVHHDEAFLPAADGHKIYTQTWRPGSAAAGVIQVLHGLGECSDRYARFATAASERGMAVVAQDFRGCGRHADTRGYFSANHGWRKICDDVELINAAVRRDFAGTPVIMLGHSLGSFVAQAFAMYWGARLDGLILSGSTWTNRALLIAAGLLAQAECWRTAPHGHSGVLDWLGFSRFNHKFRPARTPVDWLSRDEAEVDKYVADPLCGGPFTSGMWRDIATGLREITSDAALNRIPSDLPILITGGGKDPVGGEAGMGSLALHYAQTLHNRMTVRIYAEGRHELLNDVDRDAVTSNWLDWIAATTRSGR